MLALVSKLGRLGQFEQANVFEKFFNDKQPNLTLWLTSWFPSIKTMIASTTFADLTSKWCIFTCLMHD